MDFNLFDGSGSDGLILAKEFVEISRANGWGKDKIYDLEKVDDALRNTFYVVVIRSFDGNLLGCARALSDGMFFTTIPDIFVSPSFHGKGFGTILMEKIKDKLGHTVIYFGSQIGKEKFYEKLGFEKGLQSYTGKFIK